MISSRISPAVVALALLVNIQQASVVYADLVGIQYWDIGSANPNASGGPLWTGVVDTITNNLRIDTWQELPLHGTEFWVPAGLPQVPLIWNARDATGAVFDVSNDFGPTVNGTVSIDNNFAFISPVAAQDMGWVYDIDGDGIDPEAREIGTIVKPTRIGWGGFARQETQNGPFTFYTSAIGTEPAYNEKTMPRLPVEDPNSSPFSDAMLASLDGTVVVTSREQTLSPIIFAVPESSAFLCVGLIAAASAGVARWKQQRLAACARIG